MTKVKLCGLSKKSDILASNELLPDYIGFVFWKKSKRYVTFDEAGKLKSILDPGIKAVGVFVDEDLYEIAALLKEGIIDVAQLHGSEDDAYIKKLRHETGKPVIKAFRIRPDSDVMEINSCLADMILVDSGAGGGMVLDPALLKGIERPYFLAGGLSPDNISEILAGLSPYGVDVSSGIETDGIKDSEKMRLFVEAVRRVK